MEYDRLTQLIRDDMRPALGCTEPGIIALACAKAASVAGGAVRTIDVYVNSGIYKNAYTCGIPGTDVKGNGYAAALGAISGNPDKGLMALEGVTEADIIRAGELISEDRVHVTMHDISPVIYVDAIVRTDSATGHAKIEGDHNFFTLIQKDDDILLEASFAAGQEQDSRICDFTFDEFRKYADNVRCEDIAFIESAVVVNNRLIRAGHGWDRCRITDGFKRSGRYDEKTAAYAAAADVSAAIEARFLGASDPAMSITGSGAHGIICTVPLMAEAQVTGIGSDRLLRAIALNFLVTMYVKDCSGKLSAYCGCGIAGGLGLAYALPYLRGEDAEVSERAFNNMASSITGMICTGGNQACALKGIAAVESAYTAVAIAEAGADISGNAGILGETVEETARNVGIIADPGMRATDETILGILRGKSMTAYDYSI